VLLVRRGYSALTEDVLTKATGEHLLNSGARVFHNEEGNVCFIKKYKYKTYSKGLSIYTIIIIKKKFVCF